MYYIGTAVKSVVGIYNQINSATLTGAIDIVVIKQKDGSYIGSPFHVRFGKLGVLSSREKVVEIAVNDVEEDIQMKLGQAGEAFFVEPVKQEESIPFNLATSPIPSSTLLDQFHFRDSNEAIKDSLSDENLSSGKKLKKISHTTTEGSTSDRDNDLDDQSGIERSSSISRHISIPLARQRDRLHNQEQHLSVPVADKLTANRLHDLQLDYPLSDMDSPISSPLSRSPEKGASSSDGRNIFSDTEIEFKPRSDSTHDIRWEWGMLPEGTKKNKTPRESKSFMLADKKNRISPRKGTTNKTEGLLLDEVLAADKEVADLYFNRAASLDDLDSGYGRESTPTNDDVVAKDDVVAIDDGVTKDEVLKDEVKEGEQDDIKDDTLPLLDNDSELLADVSMSLCGGLKNRRVAPEAFLEYLVPFESFTSNPYMLSDPKLVIKINERYYNWAVAAPYIMACTVYKKNLSKDCLRLLKQQFMPKKRRGWFSWRTNEELESSDDETYLKHRPSVILDSEGDDIDSDSGGGSNHNLRSYPDDNDMYKKTLRLTSKQWASLNLKHGVNKITFTVTTRMQGTAECAAHIYLWDYSDKIVISDIDGTITKSDVLGQMFPLVGKDWSQIGVAGLFSKIQQNGYRFMYLSARAIGQAQITRDFLRSVKQGELTLPDGPVLLTPTSLLNAFKKEVIEKKPEEFKISCMRDIQNLFPSNPFYSGFGNRINDVWAYRAVGIPISRIFTINYKGEIKHELTNAFTSSYNKLIELVDQMFPPLGSFKSIDSSQSDYTAFSYWRTPMAEIPSLKDPESEDFEFP